MGPPVAGKGRVGVQEHLRPLFPEMAEKDVLGARQRPEAGQQDRAPGQKARKRLVFPHDAFFPQGACDHEGVEARGGETGLKEGFPVAGENGAERTEQRRPEGGHFAFGVEHVVWRKPVREAFLQQIGQPHTPREKARLVGFGELDAEVRARMSQFPHAMGEEGDLIELAGLAPGPGVACLPEGGHELALREHAWDEAGAGDVRGVAQALAQVTARTVVHEDDHGVAGMASGGVHEALFEGVQKIGVPRDDAERRAGDHGCVGRNLCQRIVRRARTRKRLAANGSGCCGALETTMGNFLWAAVGREKGKHTLPLFLPFYAIRRGPGKGAARAALRLTGRRVPASAGTVPGLSTRRWRHSGFAAG